MINIKKLEESFFSYLTLLLLLIQILISYIYWTITKYAQPQKLIFGFPFKYDISAGINNPLEFVFYIALNLLVYYVISVVLVYIYKAIKS